MKKTIITITMVLCLVLLVLIAMTENNVASAHLNIPPTQSGLSRDKEVEMQTDDIPKPKTKKIITERCTAKKISSHISNLARAQKEIQKKTHREIVKLHQARKISNQELCCFEKISRHTFDQKLSKKHFKIVEKEMTGKKYTQYQYQQLAKKISLLNLALNPVLMRGGPEATEMFKTIMAKDDFANRLSQR